MKKAPQFQLDTSLGPKSLDDYAGHTLVLYFYPKDMTSGCTTQAQNFRDLKHEFDAEHAHILGVSKDGLKRHRTFAEKESLNFLLGSDENGHVCKDFDVWKEKSMYGKKYMGIERSTFLIDGSGHIVREWRKVKVPGHVQEVLEAVKTYHKAVK